MSTTNKKNHNDKPCSNTLNGHNAILFLNQSGFQRLYLEYYTHLCDLEVEHISQVYYQGLKFNLKQAHFNSDLLRYVKADISRQAKHIKSQFQIAKALPEKYLTSDALNLQDKLCSYLKELTGKSYPSDQDIVTQEYPSAAKDTSLNNLERAFIDQLTKNPDDLLTSFNLAWIYFHLLENFQMANTHLAKIVDRLLLDDSLLGSLALRYLGMTYHFLGETASALSTLQRAASLETGNNQLYYLYEIAQQLIRTDNQDAAISHLKALIKQSPLYYIQLQSDPFFSNIPKVDDLLARFHAAKLEAIKETTYQKWSQTKLMQHTLPDEFDHLQLFNATYEEHLTLLAHQPYPLLCRTEKISNKLIANLERKTKITLDSINTQCNQHIQREQKKWKIINLVGVSLVYIAVLLTLASIFLFIGGDLLGLTSNDQPTNWGQLIPRLFASVLGTGIVGIILLQFNPPKLKQLAKKKSMLIEAME